MLILQEKRFLYCLANTKDVRLSILGLQSSLKLQVDFKDERLSSFISYTQHGKVDNLDIRGLWRINESLA